MPSGSGRLLVVADVAAHGGVSVYLAQLVRTARARGWMVQLLLDDGPGAVPVVSYLRSHTVVPITAPIRPDRHGEDAVRRVVLDVYKREHPDLIHAVLGSPRSVLVPRELSLNLRIPLVMTEQYVSADLDIPPALRQRLNHLYDMAAAVVFVSSANQRLLAETFGLSPRRGVLIPNSIDVPPSLPIRTTFRGLVLTVARLSDQKGIDVLVTAVGQARTRNVRLLVAGDGPQRSKLETLAALLAPDRVHFLGWREDVPALLSRSDLFVLPSRAEGLPFALLEAVAAGVPCVTTRVAGMSEVLNEGRLGVLVPPESPAALAAAMDSCFADPEAAAARASAAFHYAREHFNAAGNLERLAELWTRCVSPGHASSARISAAVGGTEQAVMLSSSKTDRH